MLFILGIIAGILLTIPSLIIGLYVKPKVERFIRQADSKLREKGKVIEPSEDLEQFEDWVDSLKNK